MKADILLSAVGGLVISRGSGQLGQQAENFVYAVLNIR